MLRYPVLKMFPGVVALARRQAFNPTSRCAAEVAAPSLIVKMRMVARCSRQSAAPLAWVTRGFIGSPTAVEALNVVRLSKLCEAVEAV